MKTKKAKTSKKSSLAKLIISYLLVVLVSALMPSMHKDYIINHVGSQVLMVISPSDAKIQGSATAFEMQAESGRVVTITNAHVCALANDKHEIMVGEKLHSGRFVPVHILEVYPDNDLCILEGVAGYSGLSLGNQTEISDSVYTVGYPIGEALNYAEGRVKSFKSIQMLAEVVKCEGSRFHMLSDDLFGAVCVEDFRAIQTDLVIYPGNSGSPMVNNLGHVVGVVFASDNRTHWGQAVPLSDLANLLKAY